MRYDTEPHETYPPSATADPDHDGSAPADTDHHTSALADGEGHTSALADGEGHTSAMADRDGHTSAMADGEAMDAGTRRSSAHTDPRGWYAADGTERSSAEADGRSPAVADGLAGDVDRRTVDLDRARREDGQREVGQVTTHEHDARGIDELRDGEPGDGEANGDGTAAVDEPATAEDAVDGPATVDGRATAVDESVEEPTTADTAVVDEPATVDGARPDEPARGSARVENPAGTATADAAATAQAAAATTMWPDGTADAFRNRWREVQLRFVDDPQGAADEAGQLVGEVIDALAETFRARHDGAREWRASWDTEALRTSVRQYRDVMQKLLSM